MNDNNPQETLISMTEAQGNSPETGLWMITGQSVTPPSTSQDKPKTGTEYSGSFIGDNDLSEIFTPPEEKTSIPVSKLQQNLNQFLGVVGKMFVKAEQETRTK